MSLSKLKVFRFFLLIVSIVSCANRGTPDGGEKDVDPPVIVKSVPKNFSTNFKNNEIIIYFDEYVKLKNLETQLIISPPMETSPTISPMGTASKYISIKIKDTLEANTTYAFNFGQSIVDNNEENPYPYFRFVFSTGPTIDSLSVKGYVADALKAQPDSFVSVMLYPVDSSYTDSIVFKQKPRYITNTLDSLTAFSIDNIKAGTYKLIALKDNNSNYKFDQKSDKIGFKEGFISVPNDSLFALKLFQEVPNFKAFRPKQIGETKIMFPYDGPFETMRIKVLEQRPDGFQSHITKDKDSDSLYYWYKPKFELDSATFVVTNKTYVDTFLHRFKSLDKDTLTINALSSGTLNFDADFTLEGAVPFTNIDTTKIKVIDKDSLEVRFDVVFDSIFNRYVFPIDKQEGQKYNFTFLPETFTDFYDGTNKDTLSYDIRTKMKSEFGNMRINLRNAKFPLIVQLVNQNNDVVYERYTTSSPVVDFNDLSPRQYGLRVIYDTNGNGKYDTGHFLLGIQPERVSYAPAIDEVRANFDQIIEFTLVD